MKDIRRTCNLKLQQILSLNFVLYFIVPGLCIESLVEMDCVMSTA